MTILDILDEVSRQYDIDNFKIINILKRAVCEELGLSEIIDQYIEGTIVLFEYFIDKQNKRRIKRVKITQKKLAYIRDRMYHLMIDDCIKTRYSTIKQSIQRGRIVRGEIISACERGIGIKTKYGDAFAPLNLLNKIEIEKGIYKIGESFDFHVYKIALKKDRINIVLDRVSKSLTEHIIHTVLGDEKNIYSIKRMFGERIKVYLDKEPNDEEKEILGLMFTEKIFYKIL